MTNPDVEDTAQSDGFLDLFASFGLTLTSLRDEVKRQNDMVADARRNLPRQLPIVRESVNATSADVLEFGGPVDGRKWEVRLLGAYAVTAGAYVAMATTPATWFVGQNVRAAAGILDQLQVRWQRTSIPCFDDFSGDIIQVLPREKLFLGLTGIPVAPTNIYGLAVVNDMPLFVGRVVSGS